MEVVSLNNEFSYSITSNHNHGGGGTAWILSTGFWNDTNIWLDEQTWNDG
jgi:hypothetical protein